MFYTYILKIWIYLHTHSFFIYIQESICNVVALLHWSNKNQFDPYCTDVGSQPSGGIQKTKLSNELPESESYFLFPSRFQPP